ncbi:hypothetical protein L228DRAFT_79310 [Xylona heveae TC161]|uniref:Uncharacterized protein n=1 Tax=Xylona heveae (strain CBS 132557 / TC161) TaxID=1328760 RepID=A0A165IZB6_XYLHT|nr:hypothetical protein L228DRAFT_79310 [Xylona heveae TC161]KZF25580.1 hypothetical protein L228DRAFT_79310 [Xylona heveae TC161]
MPEQDIVNSANCAILPITTYGFRQRQHTRERCLLRALHVQSGLPDAGIVVALILASREQRKCSSDIHVFLFLALGILGIYIFLSSLLVAH